MTCARQGNQSALSDAGTGGALALACAEGAYYNVRINLKALPDLSSAGAAASDPTSSGENPVAAAHAEQEEYRENTLSQAEEILTKTRQLAEALRVELASKL